ncbi:MAG: adenosine deaminase [Bifidobacteriaceae bacterium]|jgi:adenosine deaminase|nr:adenosine deaminase [Bifidobacteriaceae bacterium]
MRNLSQLPKCHLHLHFVGSMRGRTLIELCRQKNIKLPYQLLKSSKVMLDPSQRGWHKFQELYEIARSCIDHPQEIQRILFEAVEDDQLEGSRRLEIQVDPTTYVKLFDNSYEKCVEFILEQLQAASAKFGVEVGLIIAASRLHGGEHALKLAELAAKYADQGVIGFGLSNDERVGSTSDFVPAFDVARQAGLILVPHGGEILGPNSLKDIIEKLHPQRIGHGVSAVGDPQLLREIVAQNITLEFSPVSNLHLGVVNLYKDFPLHKFLDAGVRCCLNADDPLLFEHRLLYQYVVAREYMRAVDSDLAQLAKYSIIGSTASHESKRRWLKEVDQWQTV